MQPRYAQSSRVGKSFLDPRAELFFPAGKAGDAALAGGPVARRHVEENIFQMVLTQLPRHHFRLVFIGEQVLDCLESGQTPRPAGAAIRSLVGFRRVALPPGESTTVEFSLQPEQIAPLVSGGKSALEPGSYALSVGGQQPGFTGMLAAATTQVLTTSIQLQ